MYTRVRIVPLFLVFIIVLLACTPSMSGTETSPSPDQVATVVAQTLQPSKSEASANLLPHSLYFLGKDSQSLMQVFRLERDGKTQTQLTSELVNVLDYDVSSKNGSLVYEVDNQLILVNADGSNRRVIAEGAVHGFGRGIYRPVFSPDGGLLAYRFGGLALYSVEGGGSNLVVQDRSDNDPLGRESYVPHLFSSDGTKLLVYMLHVDTSSVAIYDLHANTLVRFPDKTDDDFACCGLYREVAWAPDSASFYSANPTPGMDAGGLWQVDAITGEVTTIVPYGSENNTMNFVDEPYAAPGGQLYFFYSSYSGDLGPLHRAPVDLEIVHTAGNAPTEHTTLAVSEALRMMNEALWAPDGSFVIVALAPGEDIMDGGQAEIVYFDGRPNVVLATFAQEMKWGP